MRGTYAVVAVLDHIADGGIGAEPFGGEGAIVYYKNVPGKFIAATVYDPDQMEIVEGATVTATSGRPSMTRMIRVMASM